MANERDYRCAKTAKQAPAAAAAAVDGHCSTLDIVWVLAVRDKTAGYLMEEVDGTSVQGVGVGSAAAAAVVVGVVAVAAVVVAAAAAAGPVSLLVLLFPCP